MKRGPEGVIPMLVCTALHLYDAITWAPGRFSIHSMHRIRYKPFETGITPSAHPPRLVVEDAEDSRGGVSIQGQ